MLHDEFRLVVVVVILSKFMGENPLLPDSLHRFTCYSDILNLQLSCNTKNLTIILPNSLKHTQIYIA